MIAKITSAAYWGIHAYPVDVEVDVGPGMPQFNVVGLPDQGIKESRERIRSAIKNSGYAFPPDKITINLAPADLKKEGASFDLPMALGILASMGMISQEALMGKIFMGEVALDGSLRPIKGAIVITSALKHLGDFIFPRQNAAEASLERKASVYPFQTLKEVVDFLQGNLSQKAFLSEEVPEELPSPKNEWPDFSEVRGQKYAKRAIEVAVAGNHNILLIGPPGAGKSMLSQRIPSLLPPLSLEESLEITKIYSVSGFNAAHPRLMNHRPFRAPHHSISPVALAGGGSSPKPGEISLAHGGVLFLDEFPEFRRDVLESLRAPMEEGEITISRVKMQATYPARILLVAAMNPCPCGYLTDTQRACRCNLGQIQKYKNKLSGPILDRIDLQIELAPVPYQVLASDSTEESSAAIRKRIARCRKIQAERYGYQPFKFNSNMRSHEIRRYIQLTPEAKKMIEAAMKEIHLSARAYYKILKIARTIADLTECENIQAEHVAEAIQYRTLDRQW